MPLYSYACESCAATEDRFATMGARNDQRCACGARLTRTYTNASSVIDDSIPGGFVQENFGDQPETFYSKREMALRAKELGLEPMVRWSGPNDRHVKRWDAPCQYTLDAAAALVGRMK